MKSYYYFLFFTLLSCGVETEKNYSEIIELPLEIKDGYGSFNPSASLINLEEMNENSPWINTNVDVSGIPENWTNPIVKQIWFDARQFAYQNFIASNIDSAMFNNLKKEWNFDPKKESYSENIIKSFTHIIFTETLDGNILYRLDTDNDRDFNDEETFRTKNESGLFGDGKTHIVKYEAFRNGINQELETNLKISSFPLGLLHNFSFYYTTSLNNETIQVSNGFGSTNFRDITSIILNPIDSVIVYEPIGINEYLKIKDNTYQNLGVDEDKMVLKLKQLPPDTLLYSTQKGFLAKPISGKEFSTELDISLSDYKGKFVFLDFWGSWCSPCISELPMQVYTYQNIDTSKIQFLGIAKDTPIALNTTIEKFKITWPQILSDEIPNQYGVTGYPTSYLIDPIGNIVAKNLIGPNFSDTLNSFIQDYFNK